MKLAVNIVADRGQPMHAIDIYRELEKQSTFQLPPRPHKLATTVMLNWLHRSRKFDRIGTVVNSARWWPRGYKQKL